MQRDNLQQMLQEQQEARAAAEAAAEAERASAQQVQQEAAQQAEAQLEAVRQERGGLRHAKLAAVPADRGGGHSSADALWCARCASVTVLSTPHHGVLSLLLPSQLALGVRRSCCLHLLMMACISKAADTGCCQSCNDLLLWLCQWPSATVMNPCMPCVSQAAVSHVMGHVQDLVSRLPLLTAANPCPPRVCYPPRSLAGRDSGAAEGRAPASAAAPAGGQQPDHGPA